MGRTQFSILTALILSGVQWLGIMPGSAHAGEAQRWLVGLQDFNLLVVTESQNRSTVELKKVRTAHCFRNPVESVQANVAIDDVATVSPFGDSMTLLNEKLPRARATSIIRACGYVDDPRGPTNLGRMLNLFSIPEFSQLSYVDFRIVLDKNGGLQVVQIAQNELPVEKISGTKPKSRKEAWARLHELHDRLFQNNRCTLVVPTVDCSGSAGF